MADSSGFGNVSGAPPKTRSLPVSIESVKLLKLVMENSSARRQRIWLRSSIALLALGTAASPAFAQRTVVNDAGGGRKIELHYNAAGKVTETRTIGADGKLLQKDVLEYPPGALIPETVSTSYWPNGKPHRIARNTYDNNSNFTGEFIQLLDESGKQIAGHKLTHDPQTNVYRCADWSVARQDYQTIECPAGEESEGTPETVKKFKAEEARQQLTRARQAAQQAEGARPSPGTAARAAAANNAREVGLVLPAHIRPGERVSGSVVEDPSRYEEMPEVMMTRVVIPFTSSGSAANLSGWMVGVAGQAPQRADGPIVLTVPPGQRELTVLFQQAEAAGAPISKTVRLPVGSGAKAKAASLYLAPALCLKGQLCVIRGAFGGDSSKTFAAFEERPAKIVAETADAAYLAIPEATEAGLRPLVLAEGPKIIAFPTVVAQFSMPPERRDLPKGETLLVYPTLEGPEELSEPEWRPGNYPPSGLEQARKLLPGFQLPKAGREAHEQREAGERDKEKASAKREDEENEGGEILLVVKNLTPEAASFRESKNGMYVFHLTADSFKMGEFKYKFVVEANRTGNFGVEGHVIPFLAPVMGQEFAAGAASTGE